jgi:DNA-binding MarR family transcriptional regulator
MIDDTNLDEALALLHFGFRELTAEPDALLAQRGLSRLHHRILYFCRRNKDLALFELFAILEVSKQAANRPLRELIDRGLLRSVADPADKRTRRLRLTSAGKALEHKLSEPQRRAVCRAFVRAGKESAAAWASIMQLLAAGKSEQRLRDATREVRSP